MFAAVVSTASPACVVEEIDRILAERGVTECSTATGLSSSSLSSSTTGIDSTSSNDTSHTDTIATSTGIMHTSEQPDTSTTDDSSEGSSTGTAPVCGNGIVEPGEDCDDTSTYCNTACIRSRYVFVTSEPLLLAGDIDGLIGADYECRHRAAVAGLLNAERYRAWISTSMLDARDRVEHHAGRYILVNGLIVAENWQEFASDTHKNAIIVTENSQTLNTGVWTGTNPDGTRIPGESHCQDWTSSSDLESGFRGDSATLDTSWTRDQLNPFPCGVPYALYCIEQS